MPRSRYETAAVHGISYRHETCGKARANIRYRNFVETAVTPLCVYRCASVTIYYNIHAEMGSGFSRSWVYARVYYIIILYLYLCNAGREQRERSIVVVWPSRLTGREKVRERTIIYRVAKDRIVSVAVVVVVSRTRGSTAMVEIRFFSPPFIYCLLRKYLAKAAVPNIYIYIYTYNSEYCRRGPVNYIPPISRSIRAARGAPPTT